MSLPVHPTQLDTRPFVRVDSFGMFAPFPQVPVPPAVAPHVTAVLSFLTINIQQNSNNSPLRIFFTNLISRNNWQNEECAKVVAVTLEITEYRIATANGNAHPDLLRGAVDDAVTAMVAFYGNHYINQGLAQFIDQNTFNSVQQALQFLGQMQSDIGRFKQMQMGGGYGYGGYNNGYPANNYQNANAYGGFNSGGVSSSSFYGSGPAQPFGGDSLSSSGRLRVGEITQQAPQANRFVEQPIPTRPYGGPPMRTGIIDDSSWETMTHNAEVETTSISFEDGKIEAFIEPRIEVKKDDNLFNGRAFVDLTPLAQQAAPAAAPQPPKAEEAPEYTLTDPNDPFKEIVFRDGMILRRAADSGWKRTWTTKEPYRPAYNPKTHFKVHARTPDGVIYERLQNYAEVGEEQQMETYEQHELNPTLRDEAIRLKSESSGLKEAVDWGSMIDLTPEKDKPYALPKTSGDGNEFEFSEGSTDVVALAENLEMSVVSEVIPCTDPRASVAVALARNPELDPIMDTSPLEYYIERRTPRITNSNLGAAVTELSQCLSCIEARDKLAEARKQFPDDADFFDLLEERLTEQLNYALRVSIGVGWSCTSFSEDIEPIIVDLRNDYGDHLLEQFMNIGSAIVGRAISTAGEHAEDLLCDGGKTPASIEGRCQIIVERMSITSIPYRFEDLDVEFDGIGAVSKSTMPELYSLIHGIFTRTQDHPTIFSNRYIRTKDRWLEVHAAVLTEDTYLISFYDGK